MICPALLKRDLKMIFRDPIMFLILMIPFILALLTTLFYRYDPLSLLPFETDGTLIGLMLRKTLPLFGGLFGGWITGFCLLEEREGELEPQLNVSPLTPRSRRETRLLLTLITGLAVNGLLFAADRALYKERAGSPLFFAGAALSGPFVMSLMDRWGRNRVQGLTLAKLSSLILVPPLLSQGLPSLPRLPLLILSPLTGIVGEDPVLLLAGWLLLPAYTLGVIRLFRKRRV